LGMVECQMGQGPVRVRDFVWGRFMGLRIQ
jgi:hypothetical protein